MKSFKNTPLSNMWICARPLIHLGLSFATSEQLYYALSFDIDMKIWADLANGYEAKKYRKSLGSVAEGKKLKAMKAALKRKFQPGTPEAEYLLATGDQELVEGNYWHDNFWGDCTCNRCSTPGKNHLGRLLMELRNELKHE